VGMESKLATELVRRSTISAPKKREEATSKILLKVWVCIRMNRTADRLINSMIVKTLKEYNSELKNLMKIWSIIKSEIIR
jgi:hypothetical protein